MDVKSFPFRLDQRTHQLLSGIINALNGSGAKLQSLMQDQCVITFDKSMGPGADVMTKFTDDGILLRYPLQRVAKSNKESGLWLNNLHSFLQNSKKATLRPVRNRCHVDVIARYDGRVEYFLTYLVIYDDESIAQDTPQGAMFASESINIARRTQSKKDQEVGSGFW